MSQFLGAQVATKDLNSVCSTGDRCGNPTPNSPITSVEYCVKYADQTPERCQLLEQALGNYSGLYRSFRLYLISYLTLLFIHYCIGELF